MGARARSGPIVVAVLAILAVVLIGFGIGTLRPTAVAALSGLAVVPVLVAQPFIGIVAVTATFPFEAAVMFGGATITKLLGVMVAAAWVLHKLLRGESWSAIARGGLLIIVALLLGFAALSIFWADHTDVIVSRLIRLGMLVALAFVILDLVNSWERAEWIAKALVIGGIIASCLTIAQYYGLGVRRAGEDIAGGIDATAVILVSMIPFAFFLLRAPKLQRWRLVGLLYLVLGLIAISLTLSRMAFLLVPIVLFAEYWRTFRARQGRFWVALLALVGVVAFIGYVPLDELRKRADTIQPYLKATLDEENTPEKTTSSRGYHIKIALAIFTDHPLVGVGYHNYGYHFLDYQHQVPGSKHIYTNPRSSHGTFYGILADLGIVGLLLWMGLLIVTFRNLKLAWSRLSSVRTAVPFMIVQALTFSFAIQTVYGFYDEIHEDKLFWLLVGLAVAIRQLSSRERPTTPELESSAIGPVRASHRTLLSTPTNAPASYHR